MNRPSSCSLLNWCCQQIELSGSVAAIPLPSPGIGIIKITAIPQPPPRPSGTPTKIPLLWRGGRRSLTGWCCFTRHHRGYQPQRVYAFYGVRTGFSRRGGVSFFTWPGQLVLDDWGAECRLHGLDPALPDSYLVAIWCCQQIELSGSVANKLRSRRFLCLPLAGARCITPAACNWFFTQV